MPDLPDFLEGFGVRKGLKLKGWELIKIDGQHNTILRYHQYEYPISCTFQQSQLSQPFNQFNPSQPFNQFNLSQQFNPFNQSQPFNQFNQSNLDELLIAFKILVQGTRIINSRWGNPYQCDFGDPKIKQIDPKTVIIETVGHSVRIYH